MGFLSFLGRILCYFVYAWFALAFVFLALPSPSVESEVYATNILRDGKPLTRVYNVYDIYTSRPHFSNLASDYFTGFILDFTYDRSARRLDVNGATYTLEPPLTSGSASVHGQKFDVRAGTGGQDNPSAPWFAPADSLLISHSIRTEVVKLPLEARWPTPTTLELWLAQVDSSDNKHAHKPTGTVPILTIGNAFHAEFTATVPGPPYSHSPSATFPLRSAIFVVIAVLHVFTGHYLDTFSQFLQPYVEMAVLFWLLTRGRRRIIGLLRRRGVFGTSSTNNSRPSSPPRIWGASGPLRDGERVREKWDLEKGVT